MHTSWQLWITVRGENHYFDVNLSENYRNAQILSVISVIYLFIYLLLSTSVTSTHSCETIPQYHSVLFDTLFRDWILLVCFSWRYEATEGPRVNCVMREALFEIYTWILCRFIPPWETNKKNSILILILYQNCTVLATKYPFFNTKHPVIILRASLFVVTPSHVASWKIECQNLSYVYRSRKHWKC